MDRGRPSAGLPVEAGHGFDAGLESVLLVADLAYRIGGVAQGLWGGAAGDDDMLHGRAGGQLGEYLGQIEPAVFEGIGHFIEHDETDRPVGQVVAGHLPGSLGGTGVTFLILALPNETLAAEMPADAPL